MENIKLSELFTYKKLLGYGTFGEVWKIKYLNNKKFYACKEDKILNNKKSTIIKECEIYEYLHKNKFGQGLPKYYGYITTNKKNIIFLELLGNSLDSIIKKKITLDNNTILLYSIQILNLIKKIHNFGFIHRDIKPQNFILSLDNKNIVNICDFGLSKKYIINGKHIPINTNRKFIGTIRYASTNIHNNIEPSRRDDLISFLYMIIYLTNKILPWQNLHKNKKIINKELIIMKKNNINLLCKNLKYIKLALQYCINLKFDETPNYDYINDMLIKQYNN